MTSNFKGPGRDSPAVKEPPKRYTKISLSRHGPNLVTSLRGNNSETTNYQTLAICPTFFTSLFQKVGRKFRTDDHFRIERTKRYHSTIFSPLKGMTSNSSYFRWIPPRALLPWWENLLSPYFFDNGRLHDLVIITFVIRFDSWVV